MGRVLRPFAVPAPEAEEDELFGDERVQLPLFAEQVVTRKCLACDLVHPIPAGRPPICEFCLSNPGEARECIARRRRLATQQVGEASGPLAEAGLRVRLELIAAAERALADALGEV